MAITVVASAVVADTAAGAVDTFTMPAGIAAGDGALLFFGYASGAITTAITDNGLSTPFTQVGTAATFSGHQSQLWSVQNLVAADSGKVVTLTQSTGVRQAGVLVVYRGVSRSAMVNAFASKTATVSTASPSTPTVVTTAAGCVEVGYVCATRGSSTPQIATVTPPAGSTIGAQDGDPAAGGAVTTAASYVYEGHNFTAAASGATVGGDTYTQDVGSVYSAWTVALAPTVTTGPTVDAGGSQTVAAGGTVTLSGTDAAASGTTITSRAWTALTYPGTTAPTITGGTTATATFTTAATGGTYTFRYRVTDSTGTFKDATATVWATVTDSRPVSTASAGAWTAVGAATIHAALADESTTTYAESGENPQSASFTVNLAPSPVGGKTVTYSLIDSAATPAGSYLVELLSAGVVAASWNETVGGTQVDRTRVLTDAQNAAVTDSNVLALRFTGTAG